MLSSTFAISASSFSRLYVPQGKSGNLRRYYCVVPIQQIPDAWKAWLEINARESTDKGKVPNAIRQTLIDNPEWFAEYNRGLTVVASSVSWDNRSNVVTLEFKDRQYNGVLDGGHTLQAILDQREDVVAEGGLQEGYCNLEIFTGLEQDSIPSVVEARNTSKQVASKSLMNLDGKFDQFRDAIGEKKADKISWKENDEGIMDVREFIAMLTALDADSYSDSNHPITAYSGKETCLKQFASNRPSYVKLLEIAPDILDMWDWLQYCLPDQYNEKFGGRFGALSGIKTLSGKRQKDLPFIGYKTGYDIPTGYLYPILASFRAMLVEVDGRWGWGKGLDPLSLIQDGLAGDIFLKSIRDSINNYRNPNRTGKDAQAWTAAYQAAEIYYLKQN